MRVNLTIALATLTLLSACGQRARYIEPGSDKGIINVGEVNARDVINASKELVELLLYSEESVKPLQNFDGDGKPTLTIGKITNDTSSRFNVSWISDAVEAGLINSGIAKVQSDSSTTKEQWRKRKFLDNESTVTRGPDFIFEGTITYHKEQARRARSTTYSFMAELHDVAKDETVWKGIVLFSKLGEKDAIEF